MDTGQIILGISNIFVSVLVIAISIPLVLEKIPMNQVYGVRFQKSFESKENWYKINKYGGKQLIIWAILLLFIGILTFFLPIKGNTFLAILIACAPIIFLFPALISYRYSKKM